MAMARSNSRPAALQAPGPNVFIERFCDEMLGDVQSEDLTRGDMMTAAAIEMSGDSSEQPGNTGELLGDAYTPVDGVPVTSIWGVDFERPRPGGVVWTRIKFQTVPSESNCDLDRWPARGWLTVLCSNDVRQSTFCAWFVSVDFSR